MLLYRAFDVGDAVDVAGTQGRVESVNLLSTCIKTFDNKLVIVPNNGEFRLPALGQAGGLLDGLLGHHARGETAFRQRRDLHPIPAARRAHLPAG
jgi:hypothetical protein